MKNSQDKDLSKKHIKTDEKNDKKTKPKKRIRKKVVVKKRVNDKNKKDRALKGENVIEDNSVLDEFSDDDMQKTRIGTSISENNIENIENSGNEKAKPHKRRRRKRGKQQPLWKKILKISFIVIFSLCFIGGCVGLGVAYKWMSEAPELDMSKFEFVGASAIYDINDDYYQELQTAERRDPVTIQEVPELVQLAFVSIEDQRFYSHFGVDVRGTAKAIIGVLTAGSTDGPGGSTITQQLIKQTHLTSETSIKRKVMEWKLAYQLEKQLSKREILQAYLNKINLSSAWGIESASQLYFGISVNDLSVAQAAVMASIMKAPTYYNPYTYLEDEDGNYYLARETTEDGKTKVVLSEENKGRSKIIVDKLLELGHISEREHDIAINELDQNLVGLISPKYNADYTYFTDAVYNEVVEDLQEKYNMTYSEATELLLNGGINIYSTVDPVIQKALDYNAADDDLFVSQTWEAAQASEAMSAYTGEEIEYMPEIAGAIIDNDTGYVVGILGGRNKQGSLTMNRALQKFQTGSTTKPVTAYAPAIETGTVTLATTFDDIPLSFSGWAPTNADFRNKGLMTVRDGLKLSQNVIAVQVEALTGHEVCATYAEKFGLDIVHEDDADLNGAALALGGYTYGQTPLAMASAYSVFANGGYRYEPTFYRYVTDSEGNVILESKPLRVEVVSEQTAWLITDVLKQVVSGAMVYFPIPGHEFAGKTGTTDAYVCGWFCGYTADYSCSFWMGYDQQKVTVDGTTYDLRLGIYGGATGGPAHFGYEVMKDIYEEKDMPNTYLPSKPEKIVEAKVDRISGRIPTDLTAKDDRDTIITEYFTEGTVPEEPDDYHREFLICADTGDLATANCPNIVKKVMVYKDPAVVYIAGGMPYRDDKLVGEDDEGYIAPSDTCTRHSVDDVAKSLLIGTVKDDITSVTSDVSMTNEETKTLYTFTQSVTGVTKFMNLKSLVVTVKDPSIVSVEYKNGILTVTPLSNGTTQISFVNVFNKGITGALGLPAAPSLGEVNETSYEYTISGEITVNVSGFGVKPVEPNPTPGEEGESGGSGTTTPDSGTNKPSETP